MQNASRGTAATPEGVDFFVNTVSIYINTPKHWRSRRMPYFHVFLWDGLNDAHVAEHGITTDEFEQVVMAAYESDVEISRSSDRLVVIGRTEADRKICCVFEVIDEIYCYPVTAFDVD